MQQNWKLTSYVIIQKYAEPSGELKKRVLKYEMLSFFFRDTNWIKKK